MKRVLFFFLLALILCPVFVFAVLAPDCPAYCADTATPPAYTGPPAGAVCVCNPLSYGTFEELVEHITDFLATIAVVVAPILIIYAGFLFVTSGGKTEQITQAKTIIIWTIIGFSIVWLARALIEMIKQILGITP